jgi:chromosome partitioning protein
MITTIVHAALPAVGAVLAENLARQAGLHGRHAVLLDASAQRLCERWSIDRVRSRVRPTVATRTVPGGGLSAELERLLPHFDDVVIDTEDCSASCRSALIAAQVALVPLTCEHADIDARYPLIARLNSARMFNPGLRVLFVPVGGERDPAPQALAAIRAYAGQVMSAGVARTVAHLPALRWGGDVPGHCASDIENSTGAAEMAALYGEVHRTFDATSPTRRSA